MKDKMKMVILSRNPRLYSTERIREAGEKRGHEMLIIDHTKCDIVIEKNKPQIYYKGESLAYADAVIPRIGASVTFYGASVIRQFEMMKIFTATSSQALIDSRDKLRSLQLMSNVGLGMPKTVFTNYSKDVENIIEMVGGVPCILKLLEGTQGEGVVLAETLSATKSVLEAFNSLETRVLTQQFISEAGGADLRAFVVGGVVVGAMKRQAKEGEFRSNLHLGGSATTIKLSEEEEQAALNAAKTLGLAIAGVDMLQSNSGPMILEVNSSPGLEGIEKATGKDIATYIIRYIEHNAH
jgi:ribosomal protein S6--L-glutamate ligase